MLQRLEARDAALIDGGDLAVQRHQRGAHTPARRHDGWKIEGQILVPA
jgi:hypothetical protein